MKNSRVLVLLSSYNGEKFISEQISSIFDQVGVEVHLLIRDDGSKDSTCSVIENLADPRITLIKGNNIGCIDSFSSLIKEASFLIDQYDYFAFSDQDDVWLSDKLISGVNVLTKQRNNIAPLLYACNLNIVDADNNFIRISHQADITLRKGAFLIDSKFPGCAMIFNSSALKLYQSNPPRGGLYHDHWLTLICLYFGKVIYDSIPHINYRQHANNVLGAHHFLLSTKEDLKRKIREFIHKNKTTPLNSNEVSAFLETFRNRLNEKDIRVIEHYLNYSKSLKSRLFFAFQKIYFPPEGGRSYYKHVILHIIRVFLNRI